MLRLKINYNAKVTLCCLGILLFGLSCKKKEDDFVFMNVSPTDFFIAKKANEFINFDISAQSNVSALSYCRITVKEDNVPLKVLLDTTINTKRFRYYLDYEFGSYLLNRKFVFTFFAENQEGRSFTTARNVTVLADTSISDTLLTESTTHFIYSLQSADPRTAFDLKELTSLTQGISDSTRMDLLDTTNSDVLSRVWRSYTGVNFVRSNGFNYATATKSGLINTYAASNKTEIITNIQADDIILVYCPPPRNFYAAIRVVNVTDQPGSANDRYEFNVKK